MHYKSLLIILVSLSLKGSYPEVLVGLLDEVHAAQAYWDTMYHTKTKTSGFVLPTNGSIPHGHLKSNHTKKPSPKRSLSLSCY